MTLIKRGKWTTHLSIGPPPFTTVETVTVSKRSSLPRTPAFIVVSIFRVLWIFFARIKSGILVV
jgi:hypothetical protein